MVATQEMKARSEEPARTSGGLVKSQINMEQSMYEDVLEIQRESGRKSRSDTMCYLIARGLEVHRHEQALLRHVQQGRSA